MPTTRVKATIDPALVEILSRYQKTPDPADVGIAEARRINEAYFRAISEPKLEVRDVRITHAQGADGHTVPVKVVTPLTAKAGGPAVLYCHGGGYAFGDLETHDAAIRAFAAATSMAVFAVHYRRTPEWTWPAPLEDALAVVTAMRSTDWASEFGHDPDRLVTIGD